ncbi:MAG: aspartate kinase [Myxococcaceae bacterium]
MAVLVQKYGGSSVADAEKIRRVAAKVKAKRDQGYRMVVVVSAMGDTTDELLTLAKQISHDPPRRELDMLLTCGERISMALLSMALQEMGCPAISFTGSQSGIITNDAHAQARIVEVRPFRIQDELEAGKVVIVAGYQGVSYKREVTTLGRGGSDTTAVALAAALEAEACEIYSDVDGVLSADPRVVPEAKKLAELSYEEMQELASAGAKVLNAQAVEFARQKGITILAKSSFGTGVGTAVRELSKVTDGRVTGVTSEKDLCVIRFEGEARSLGELIEFLDSRGARSRWLAHEAGRTWLGAPLENVHGLDALIADLHSRFGSRVQVKQDLGTVTCVGAGINADGATLRKALALVEHLKVPLAGVQTSALQVTLLVPKTALGELTQRLHQELIG